MRSLPWFRSPPVRSQPAELNAGGDGLAVPAAASQARYKIRGNDVAPGLNRTPLTLTQVLTNDEAALKIYASLPPPGHRGEPDRGASAIRWSVAGPKRGGRPGGGSGWREGFPAAARDFQPLIAI